MANTLKVKLDGTNVLTQSVMNGIDTSQSPTTVSITSSAGYTASEDCWAIAHTSRTQGQWFVDDVAIFGSGGSTSICPIIPLKAGQTLKTSTSNTTEVLIWKIKR